MPKRSETKPWERQDKEGEKPFEAFVIYRDMGEKRTLQAVADKLRKSYTLIRRWKDTWAWEDRVRAYDNNLQKEAHAEAVKKARKMADRHIGICSPTRARLRIAGPSAFASPSRRPADGTPFRATPCPPATSNRGGMNHENA